MARKRHASKRRTDAVPDRDFQAIRAGLHCKPCPAAGNMAVWFDPWWYARSGRPLGASIVAVYRALPKSERTAIRRRRRRYIARMEAIAARPDPREILRDM